MSVLRWSRVLSVVCLRSGSGGASGAVAGWAALALVISLVAGCGDDSGGGSGGVYAGSSGSAGGGVAGHAGRGVAGQGQAGSGTAGQGQAGSGVAGQGQAGGVAGSGIGGGAAEGMLCPAYIACTAATNPGGLGVILAAYGDQGNCWTQGKPALCDSACEAGIVQAHKAFPAATACNFCQKSTDCPSALPACDLATNSCVACLDDGDCKTAAAPACGAGHTCVGCTQDSHCKSPEMPACEVGSNSCVGCTKNADCDYLSAAVCEPGTHSCRGCQANDECASGVCEGGSCLQCKTDAQCGGATPHCNENSVCVGCVADADCPGGACNTLFGVCCGVGSCTKQAAECGSVLPLDLSCFLFPVSCGSCEEGLACVQNKCLTPPAEKCSNCSGACAYVPETNSYTCTVKSSTCDNDAKPAKACAAGYDCRSHKDENTGKYYSYCEQYCLDDGDCGSKKCTPLDADAPGLGTCQ